MIQVRLYRNFEKIKNTTKLPGASVLYTDLSCTLKEGTSVLAPSIDVLKITNNPAGMGYNYAWIPALSRYYFINDWTYDMGVWRATLSEDVLASFRSSIGNLSKYVKRSSADWTDELCDAAYTTKAKELVSYVTNGQSPFSANIFGSYIVGIIGEQQSGIPCIGGINYYLFTQEQMAEFITFLTSNGFANLISDSASGLSDEVVKAIASPTDYIISCTWFPFAISGQSGARVQPKIGWWGDIAPITGGLAPIVSSSADYYISNLMFPVPIQSPTFQIPNHSQISRGTYLNGAPYSNYVFHLDPWGDIPLNASRLVNQANSLSYSITCEGLSGLAALELYLNGELLTRQVAQVGVPMTIAQIINNLNNLTPMTAASGAFAGVKDRVTSAVNNFNFHDTLVALGQKVVDNVSVGKAPWAGVPNLSDVDYKSIGNDVINGISASAADIDARGVNGSVASYISTGISYGNTTLLSAGPYIKIMRYELVAEDKDHKGRPLYAVRTLKNIPGYIECEDGLHDIPCLNPEKSAISSYLTGGFIYE